MALIYQIPRHCLAWLLIAQVFLIAPHFIHLPLWIVGVWLIVVVWRIQVFRGHWSFPGRRVKYFMVVFCLLGLIAQYRRWYGLEPMIALLVVAFLLKLLEMHSKRDAISVLYIAYFVASTNFLFSQTLEMTVYILGTVVLVTTALVALHESEQIKSHWRSLRLAGKLIAQSIPLTVVLFVVIPRIGSLWAVPQQQQAAVTGVSDSMAPGDFSRLSRSQAVAFRVTFDGEVPPQNQLYWRGLVFSYFDGRTWRPSPYSGFWEGGFSEGGPINWSDDAPLPWRSNIETVGEGLDYDVIIEPTFQNWLYALTVPQARGDGVGLTRDYRLQRRRMISSRYRYRVTSHLAHQLDVDALSNEMRSRELRLPPGFNPQTRERVQEWLQEAENSQAYIQRVLEHFRESFIYTLEPPALGRDSIDEFLWQTQRGFCEHFASAFVFMMRAADIPARVVVGYQGGELNELENFLTVRQADAHAWAEVWLEGEGWVQFDPTASVAPDRIELGLDDALSATDAQLMERSWLDNFNHIVLMNRLQMQLELLNYRWTVWVVSFDGEQQAGVLSRLLGEINAWRVATALLVSCGTALALVGFGLFLSGRPFKRDQATRLYEQFLRQLKRRGIEKSVGEGPRTFARRAARKLPLLESWIWQVTQYYERYVYADDAESLKRMELALRSKGH